MFHVCENRGSTCCNVPRLICGVRSLAAADAIIRGDVSNNGLVSSIVPFQYSWHVGLLLQTGQQ